VDPCTSVPPQVGPGVLGAPSGSPETRAGKALVRGLLRRGRHPQFDILPFDILPFDILPFDILPFDILPFDILAARHLAARHLAASMQGVGAKPLSSRALVSFFDEPVQRVG